MTLALHESLLWYQLSGEPGTRRGRVVIAMVVVIVVISVATARLFVWPARGMPPRVNAIVMLNSTGDPLRVALQLARQQRAGFLLISQGTPASHFGCPRPVPGVKLVCFHPSPATTQGEVDFASRLAARYHWRSVALVTVVPQASRARLRLERCFLGHVYVVTAPVPLGSWPYQLAYEWGATIKALVLQRSC